jgi:hypothetical protein
LLLTTGIHGLGLLLFTGGLPYVLFGISLSLVLTSPVTGTLMYVTLKSGFNSAQLFITKDLVAEQPVEVLVNVKVTLPAETPVTTPALVTVAIELLLLVHVPPVLGVTLAVLPTHTVVAPPNVGAPGTVLIVTFALATEIHAFVLVTVKVYVAPAGKPVMVVLVVLPVVVTPPGVLVIVQLPDGKPLNTTLPVGVVHIG